MKELERLARRVCSADGYDPEVFVNKQQPQIGAFGRAVVHDDAAPQWALYAPLVKYALSALVDDAERVGGDFKAFTISILNGADAPDVEVEDAPPTPQPPRTPPQRSWRERYGMLIPK